GLELRRPALKEEQDDGFPRRVARLRAGLAGQKCRQREPGQPDPEAADPQELPTTEPLTVPRGSPVEQGQHWRNLVWMRGGRCKETSSLPPFSSAAVGDDRDRQAAPILRMVGNQ